MTSAEKAAHWRRDRIRRLREDPSLAPHGRDSTYVNWGCHASSNCPGDENGTTCSQAHAMAQRKRIHKNIT